MLERLDKLDGVTASSANHTGTMIRVSVSAAADREKLAAEARTVLSAGSKKPTRLDGEEFTKALRGEKWRDLGRIGELSAIEFRKLALDRVRKFAEEEKLGSDLTEKLVTLAGEEWDRLATGVDPKLPPHRADWSGRCKKFGGEFSGKAKGMLTGPQYERLKAACESELEK